MNKPDPDPSQATNPTLAPTSLRLTLYLADTARRHCGRESRGCAPTPELCQRPYAIVRRRLGLSLVIRVMTSAGIPASRSLGIKDSVR
jgi:hypothetical protein